MTARDVANALRLCRARAHGSRFVFVESGAWRLHFR